MSDDTTDDPSIRMARAVDQGQGHEIDCLLLTRSSLPRILRFLWKSILFIVPDAFLSERAQRVYVPATTGRAPSGIFTFYGLMIPSKWALRQKGQARLAFNHQGNPCLKSKEK